MNCPVCYCDRMKSCVWCWQEDTTEETGWKLVHGDVFRPPRYKQLLAALVGAGVQIFSMALITIGKLLVSYYCDKSLHFVQIFTLSKLWIFCSS